MNRLPNLCIRKNGISSFIVIRLIHAHGIQRPGKIAFKKRLRPQNYSFISLLDSPLKDKIYKKLLTLGFTNDVESMIYMLQQHVEEGIRPKLRFIELVANSLCNAQNKEGIVLASLLAHQNFPHFYSSMSNFEVFYPVQWNYITLDASISHFEMLYTKSTPSCVGKSFRSSILSSYLANGIKTEFLDLYYFVNDVFYYWKDAQPLTAFWEVLFCSPENEDQAHAEDLLKSNRMQINIGMKSCLLSFIITLANVGDTKSLTRLAELIKNKTLFGREVLRLYPNLQQLVIDMKYNEGKLDESMALMACCNSRHINLKGNKTLKELGVVKGRKNPKLYFADLLTVEESMLLPIPLQAPQK